VTRVADIGIGVGDHRFDGGLTCRLCADTRPSEENDWCRLAERVVCESCCRALMLGDERLRSAVAELRGEELRADDIIAECVECDRLVQLVSESVTEDDTGVRSRPH
jgi:hypothetical protein